MVVIRLTSHREEPPFRRGSGARRDGPRRRGSRGWCWVQDWGAFGEVPEVIGGSGGVGDGVQDPLLVVPVLSQRDQAIAVLKLREMVFRIHCLLFLFILRGTKPLLC